MLHLTSSCRYFYYHGFADMRKGAYSLSGLVRNEMELNVLRGDVFIFISRMANKIKLLQWDNDARLTGRAGVFIIRKGIRKGHFRKATKQGQPHSFFTHTPSASTYFKRGDFKKCTT